MSLLSRLSALMPRYLLIQFEDRARLDGSLAIREYMMSRKQIIRGASAWNGVMQYSRYPRYQGRLVLHFFLKEE
jgi:hypothetical protein